MAKGEEKEENVNRDKEKEELHNKLESKVLGLIEDTGDEPKPKEEKIQEKKEDKPEKAEKKEEPPASDKPPEKETPSKEEKTEEREPAEKKEEKPDDGPSADKEKAEGAPPEEKKETNAKQEDKEEGEPSESLDGLLAQREDVEALLSSVEDSYRDATLPDKTYHEVKNKNEKKLEEINKKIEKLQKTATPEELKKIEDVKKEAEKPAPMTPAAAPAEPLEDKPPEAQPAEAPAKAAEPKITAEEKGRIDPVIKLLEEKIEEKLRSVIDTANIEITDKRMKKLDGRLDIVERAANENKGISDTTSKTVGGYDKQFTLMKTDVEKVKAIVDGVKEAKNIMDDKFQRTTESFAEIRSIVYQREAKAKEEEVLMDKLKDAVSQVDTAKILREFTTRDEQMRDVNTRLERLERSEKMLSDSINRIKGLMTDIGSLENIVKASKHVGEKLEKIQEIEERVKASSSKLDGVYVDMKKKLDDFTEYKVKQDKLSGMADDVMKNVEELTRRLSEYATKTDIVTVKDELKIMREQAKKAQAVQVPPEVASLQEEKEGIEMLLSTLEENYKNKELAEGEYNKAKEGNMLKLAEIDKKIAAASSGKSPSQTAGEPSGDGTEKKHRRVMLLAKLRESYENGELSKVAYDKSRRLLLKKG